MTSLLKASPIEEIDHQAKEYASAREVLAERLRNLNEELAATRRRLIKGIKTAAAVAGSRRGELKRMIEEHPDLFVKPRTINLHGIKCGLREGTGAIEFADEDAVIARIEKKLPEQQDLLVKTTKKLIKKALCNLEAVDLAKIGCTVEKTGDQVVIKAKGDDVEKLVDKLVAEFGEEE